MIWMDALWLLWRVPNIWDDTASGAEPTARSEVVPPCSHAALSARFCLKHMRHAE